MPVPNQATAVRARHPLAPVAGLLIGNLVVKLDLSLTVPRVRVLGDYGVRASGPIAPAAAREGLQIVVLGLV
ncbi:MAG TPA: hypothetical protein VFO20_06235 [Propionibacteriaceae bacterium]|nr:hypothetical protein [Propionibacteriaceae bacterium]